MDEVLDDFICTITEDDGMIVVKYELSGITGECHYTKLVMRGNNKPITQVIYVMVKCNMTDVIGYMNGIQSLDETDYDHINLTIRNHSLHCVSVYDTP